MKVSKCNQSVLSQESNMHILPAFLPEQEKTVLKIHNFRQFRFSLTKSRWQFTKADHFCMTITHT